MPPVQDWGKIDFAQGALTPVTYHGGAVMNQGVEVHTIFWDGGGSGSGGRDFQGQPTGAPTNYVGMIERFFTDAAADSGGTSNVFSVLPQFASGTTPGGVNPGAYNITYSTSGGSSTDSNITVHGDVIMDHNAYPDKSSQCASPQSTAICITDPQLQAEIDHVITATGGSHGLTQLWYVFTPPDVDECISAGVCETNAYGGYHSVGDVGNGATIYAYTGDPIVESGNVSEQGKDPQGYPDAEIVADIAAHETVEAMTDPQGVGYMDPNGFEVGDKCEFGPQHGQPLGNAANGSPYNQVINGHQWYIQEMWANADNNGNPDCVQSTTNTSNPLPLPQVNLRQFSTTVSGNTENNTAGIGVQVTLLRMGADGNPVAVSQSSTTTAGNGSWSVTLSHPVGDDRDEIDVDYSGSGAPTPNHQVILTGNGGNPFTESGWTGWTAMDNGTAVSDQNSSLQIAPCFQTGVLNASIGGTPLPPPNGDDVLNDFCSTQTDVATVPLSGQVGTQQVLVSSNDNRAFQDPNLSFAPNPVGGLVDLTVAAGEPDSASLFQSPLLFAPGGFPTCAADLEMQSITCQGLIPGNTYRITDGTSSILRDAGGDGTVSVNMPVKGGDTVTVVDRSANGPSGGTPLTTLHVSNLRVDITGEQTVLSGGSCQPGDYYGAPINTPPTSGAAGAPSQFVGGPALTGAICPTNGDATGLPSSSIIQTDDHSQGSTQTEVPHVEDTSPMQGETMYGTFTALAETGLPGPNNTVNPTDSTSSVALSISKSSGGAPVKTFSNVDTVSGATVSGLAPGTYTATWTLHDTNGDTRTVSSRFVEQPALQGPPGPQGKQGPPGPRGPRGPAGPKPKVSCKLVKHHQIKCTVTYSKSKKGKLQVRISRGARVAALGHAHINGRSVTFTMREIRHLTRGAWTATVVFSPAPRRAATTSTRVRMG